MSRHVFICLFLVCGAAVAEDVKLSPRHVAVTGTSITRVQPDIVVWRINIRRMNKELAKAQSECDEGVKKVLALRTELKLQAEEVQTGYLSVQKIFDRDQAGNQTSFRHFQVERSVTLRQRDTSRFELARRHPAAVRGLQAIVAEGERRTAVGGAAPTALLALAIADLLR